MFTDILLLIGGLILVLSGAEALVDGASGVARKAGISEFVIGMTVIAFGTSAPEMVVSFISSAQGRADMAVGNIVGSNIFNTSFVLGITALICPVIVTRSNMRKDIPINIASTILLLLLGLGGTLGRVDGLLFLAVFAVYMIFSFKHNSKDEAIEEQDNTENSVKTWRAALFTVAGLAGLVFGGHLFVDSAERIASCLGMSDKLIGVTVLAFGTSLPELATSIVAAVKGKSQMALGNVLGSNVFNILLILGGAALIRPLSMQGIGLIDFTAVLLCSLVIPLCVVVGKKGNLHVWSGIVLLLIGAAYMTYLCMSV